MASNYQDFTIKVVESVAGSRSLVIKSVWYSDFVTKITAVTEISIDGGVWLPVIGVSNEYIHTHNFTFLFAGVSTNIRIREDGVRIFELGDIYISTTSIYCPDLSGDGVDYYIIPSTRLANDGSDQPLSLQAGVNGSFSSNEHSIDDGVTFKSADVDGITNWTVAEISAVPAPLKIVFKTVGDDALSCEKSHTLQTGWLPIPPTLSEVHSNVSTNGGADGSIVLTVHNGSGNFTFLWNDAITTQNRVGLPAGVYSVVVTDVDTGETAQILGIEITEPEQAISTFPNTLVTSSPINPIRFKANEIGEDMPLENYNFCEHPTENMAKPPTPEIYNVQDQTTLQFISDYEANNIKRTNLKTGAEDSLPLTLAIDYLNGGTQYASTVTDEIPPFPPMVLTFKVTNQMGVDYPNPQIGDVVTMETSDAGSNQYDGSYAIIGLVDDGKRGFWLTGSIGAGPDLNVNIKFLSKTRFNVYELPIIFSDWGVGKYRLDFETSSEGVTTTKLISETIDVKAYTPNTLLIIYSNTDNAFGVVWSTDIVMRKRHQGFFIKAVPTADSTNFRNSNDRPAVLNSYVRNKEEYRIHLLPWFSVQRLALIYNCDELFINGKKMFVEELPETEQSDSRYMLGNQTLIAEEVGWLDNQNTHDIGDTSAEQIVIGESEEDVLGI